MDGIQGWSPERKKQYDAMLIEIQVVDFVLVELNLYLDTHPQDRQAIEQYNQYTQKSQILKHRFECAFGPLTHFGGSPSTDPWSWHQPPWPWQV
ncbi:spore coat protein CotJB [Desmospora profundinema]|uniref:Spore coat protein JB n=1 Tax=Desmospora profundinema TaxID=1571184 RepID=A0ABU1IJB0_9BACL|nr:spore coat protein CotJB [Desmospora profundinema]MDR6224865.1 spore coat protein JB [Desmospora profundinema]